MVEEADYESCLHLLQSKYLDHPAFISIETDACCCIDAEGDWASGHAQEVSLLNIYNQQNRRNLRLSCSSHRGDKTCGKRPLLS